MLFISNINNIYIREYLLKKIDDVTEDRLKSDSQKNQSEKQSEKQSKKTIKTHDIGIQKFDMDSVDKNEN